MQRKLGALAPTAAEDGGGVATVGKGLDAVSKEEPAPGGGGASVKTSGRYGFHRAPVQRPQHMRREEVGVNCANRERLRVGLARQRRLVMGVRLQ